MPPKAASWDPSAKRYRDPDTGQFVSEDAVRGVVDQLADGLTNRLVNLTQDLLDRRTSLPTWQSQFADTLVDHHLAAAAIGAGGLDMLRRSEPSAAQARLADQLKFLRGFARDLESGRQPMDGRALNRARLYGSASRSAFEEQRRSNYAGEIEVEEIWLLSAAEHCSGCSAQASRGYVPRGSLPPIGSRQCRTHCRCRIGHRRNPTSRNPCSIKQGREFKATTK